MRKLIGILLLVLFTAMFISACGEEKNTSGSDADTMTVTVVSSSGTTTTTAYTEGPINNYGYYDPSMEADIFSDTGRTIITLSSGVTGGPTPPTTVLNVVANGHTAGTYLITGGSGTNSYVSYTDHGQNYDTYSSVNSSGTVTLTSVGNVGEPVKGSFSAVLSLVTSSTTTLGISGTFSMKREN